MSSSLFTLLGRTRRRRRRRRDTTRGAGAGNISSSAMLSFPLHSICEVLTCTCDIIWMVGPNSTDRGRLKNMAIIVANDQNHAALNKAVLVEEYKEQGDVVFTRYIGLVERVTLSDRERNKGWGREREGIHVRGEWVPDGIWVVG
jgi:hypothetical protein